MNFRPAATFLSLLGTMALSHAATVWTGPTITWTKSTATPSDTIVPGKVVLRRGSSLPLYNTAAGETSARPGSPKGITFAFGDISEFASLNYVTLDSLRNGNLAGRILNQPMVAHIPDGDIYFSIMFTKWGTHGSGTVSYNRSTPGAVVVPPTVTLTSPAEGATFTAPSNVTLSADASGGTITGVSFYNGTSLLGTVQSSPYNFTANNLGAGSYNLTAVAMTAETAATSGVVHITITAPSAGDVTVSPPTIVNGAFSFTYTTDPGQTYIVQSASALDSSGAFNWTSVATNKPSRSFATFAETLSSDHARFYRVGRVTNP